MSTDAMIKTIIQKFEYFRYKHGITEVFYDALAMWSFALSNKFDLAAAEKREIKYLEITKRYDSSELERLANIFADVFVLFSGCASGGVFDDYLGKIYMLMDLGNKNACQFFSPYEVSKMMAEITFAGLLPINNEIITLNEPACGAGGIILAAADVLWNKYKFNYADRLLVVAQDIDIHCVYMTYLQTALAGVPAIIYHCNSAYLADVGRVLYARVSFSMAKV